MYVIEREFLRRKYSATVLACIVIAQKNVFAREALSLERNVNVFDQANHRRQRHGKARGVKPLRRTLFGISDAFEYEHDSASRRADVDWLERSIENQNARVHSEIEI